jgi:hypothetical protein
MRLSRHVDNIVPTAFTEFQDESHHSSAEKKMVIVLCLRQYLHTSAVHIQNRCSAHPLEPYLHEHLYHEDQDGRNDLRR